MKDILNSYSKAKSELAEIVVSLGNVATSRHSKEMAKLIGDKLKANIFSLVVVGQFKRGKTTFINALLGKDLLPMAIIPLTSIITIINYGRELKIVAFFKDKTQKEITLDDLPLYVTEKHNPKNEKGVNRVEIFYPSDYLKNGVQIIDTPGIASVHEHNTKTTYEYLPNADAAIFLVSVDPPLTQAELSFLKDIKNAVSKVFFIQNKIDTVSDADRQESLAFTKKVIEEQGGFKDILIFPLSAKQALEGKIQNVAEKVAGSGLVNFEQELEKFLLNDKGNVLLRSSAEKIQNIINEELLLAELEEKSIHLPLEELENKIATFKDFIRDSEQEKIDSARLLESEIKELQTEKLVEDLEKLKTDKTTWLVKKVEELAKEHKADGNIKFAEVMDEFIAEQIRDIFGAWRMSEEKILKQQIEKILERFTARINKIIERIVRFSAELFGISDKSIEVQEALPSEFEFRFETSDESDMLGMTIDAARKALPKVLAHKLILKEAREKAEAMIDRHCGKTRYDFSQRMEQLVINYRKDIAGAIGAMQNDVLKALEAGVASKQKTAEETESLETRLLKNIVALKEIREAIRKL